MRLANFDKEMQKVISEEQKKGNKPKLLMHSCCAPCSSACIERVKEFFDLSIYYYNPNIDTEEEFDKRRDEQKRYCESQNVKFIECDYDKSSFLETAKGYENEREGGARCVRCFYLRLKHSAIYAKENGFDYFTTTLTVSPLKNSALLNEIGEKVASEVGIKFLPSDFKKRGGYLRSIELSREYDLYRQNYCGCEFSKNIVIEK